MRPEKDLRPARYARWSHPLSLGGVETAAKEADAGKALINSLKVPVAVPVLKAKGMEPMSP
jgi:hypothetical protein